MCFERLSCVFGAKVMVKCFWLYKSWSVCFQNTAFHSLAQKYKSKELPLPTIMKLLIFFMLRQKNRSRKIIEVGFSKKIRSVSKNCERWWWKARRHLFSTGVSRFLRVLTSTTESILCVVAFHCPNGPRITLVHCGFPYPVSDGSSSCGFFSHPVEGDAL